MEAIFWRRRKNTRSSARASVATRLVTPPSLTAGRDEFSWKGTFTGTPNGDAPSVLNTSYTITADIEVPADGGDGMIITQGGRFGGYGLYLVKGKPVFTWTCSISIASDGRAQSPHGGQAHHRVRLQIRRHGHGNARHNNMTGIGQAGTGTLSVDGRSPRSEDREDHPADPAMGPEPRHRRGHRHRRRRLGHKTVRLHRHLTRSTRRRSPGPNRRR